MPKFQIIFLKKSKCGLRIEKYGYIVKFVIKYKHFVLLYNLFIIFVAAYFTIDDLIRNILLSSILIKTSYSNYHPLKKAD